MAAALEARLSALEKAFERQEAALASQQNASSGKTTVAVDSSIQNRVKNLEQQQDKLSLKLERLQTDVSALADKGSVVRSDLDEALTHLGALQKEVDTCKSDHLVLHGQVQELEKSHKDLHQQFVDHDDDPTIHSASRYHYVEVKRHTPIGLKPVLPLFEIIDKVFEQRALYSPVFASWVYRVDESQEEEGVNDFIVKIIMVTTQRISSLVFSRLFQETGLDITYRSLDYLNFRRYLYDEKSRFHRRHLESNDEFSMYGGLEYWYYLALTDFDNNLYLEPQMSEEQFSKSENYKKSSVVQQFIMDKVYEDNELDTLILDKL